VIEGGRLAEAPWATVDDAVEQGESGLLGIALDPAFAQTGLVYLAYTYRAPNGQLAIRLARWVEDRAGGARRGVRERTLVDGIPAGAVHDGGALDFGPDGKLYWTVGDAGNEPLAQDPASRNGKILRLNPDGAVPNDNPFRGTFVYSLGHRNPQGLAWQPGTNALWATEHGPSGGGGSCCRDEVNLVEAGRNYGWPTIRGSQTGAGLVTPVVHSGDAETWAPSGATFVTRGPWRGSLLFTGLRGEALYRAVIDPADPRRVSRVEPYLRGELGRLRDVAEGPDGTLYVLVGNRDGRGTPRAGDDRVVVVDVR
jgi:glucose/arabinose dehydrogenase